MCKRLLWMFLLVLPWCVKAQDSLAVAEEMVEQNSIPKAKFGYLSYSQVIREMPEYLISQEKLSQLQQKYDNELLRAERDFNLRFAEFLEGQKDFPENILLKRQKELQELMEKSIKFKDEMKLLLEQARKEMSAPVIEKLNAVINQVGEEHGFEYILNTDNGSYPYINKNSGMDVTELVRGKLK